MYQWAPPGGSDSGARGVSPDEAMLGVERLEQGHEVELVGAPSVEQDQSAVRAPPAGRNRCGQPSGPELTHGPEARAD